MAEKTYSLTRTNKGDLLVTWLAVTNADTFQQFPLEEAVSEMTFHVGGTFNSATCTVQGGNITGQMLNMRRLDGTTASVTAASLLAVLERPLFIKPTATGGGGSQSLDVYMLMRR